VRRRYEYELRKLKERIHILEGFAKVFADLDAAIRIIRKSEGRRDAAEQLMDHFDLDDVQVDKVLELQLYRLAKLPIAEIIAELEEKREQAARIEALLSSTTELWGRVRAELLDIREMYHQPRRTRIGGKKIEVEYSEADYIVAEDAFVIVTREGWVKRQSSFTELSRIRIREGDEIGWVMLANTRSTVTFYSDQGGAYTIRVDDLQATSGYGEPVQKHFKFSDGERIAGVSGSDPRARPPTQPAPDDDTPAPPYGVALTEGGRIIRFALAGHHEISQRTGRRYARLAKGDRVLRMVAATGDEWVSIATLNGNALAFPVCEANVLKGPGKGVTGIKLKPGDKVLGFGLTEDVGAGEQVATTRGREIIVTPRKYGGSRAGRGKAVIQRGGFKDWVRSTERLDLSYAPEED
jgi:DNA gyrase subunit A